MKHLLLYSSLTLPFWTLVAQARAFPRSFEPGNDTAANFVDDIGFYAVQRGWKCDGETKPIDIPVQWIEAALERSVTLWYERHTRPEGGKMWGDYTRYPHKKSTSKGFFEWEVIHGEAACNTKHVGTAPIVSELVGGDEKNTPAGRFRALISMKPDLYRDDQGVNHRTFHFCGVANHPIGDSKNYKMCTEDPPSLEGAQDLEGPGQFIVS